MLRAETSFNLRSIMVLIFEKRRLNLLVSAVVFGVVSDARAESRILSVATDKQDVSISMVAAGGQPLKEVGRSGNRVFVEIGSETTGFDCRQNLLVRFNGGGEVSKSVDLCADNYQVLVETMATADVEEKSLIIQTSDPDTTIREVNLDRKYIPIERKIGNSVTVALKGDPAQEGRLKCARELKVVLGDGRVLRKPVDVCSENKIEIAIGGGLNANASSMARPAVPNQGEPEAYRPSGGVLTQPAQQAQVNGEGAQTQDIASEDQLDASEDVTDNSQFLSGAADMKWYLSPPASSDGPARLIYGERETDNVGFSALCRVRSGEARIILSQTVAGLVEGEPVRIDMSALDVANTYEGRGSSANNESGVSFPAVDLSFNDPIWSGMRRGSNLNISINGEENYTISLAGSAGPVGRFQDYCAPPAQIIEPGLTEGPIDSAPPSGSGGTQYVAGPVCADEGAIRSLQNDVPTQMLFRNRSGGRAFLYWLDFAGQRQIYAQLAPGAQVTQPTMMGYPWLVADDRGGCLGIYLPENQSQTLVTIEPRQQPAPTMNTWSTPPSGQELLAPVPPAPVGRTPEDVVTASYRCDDGAILDVAFDNRRSVANVRELGLSEVTLGEMVTGSGFRYGLRNYELQGKGRYATWTRPGAAPRNCEVF